MAVPTINQEYEERKQKAKELIAAGGCHALQFWSRTDADRLCPEQYKKFIKIYPPVYPSEWVEAANKAIEYLQAGINLLKQKT